ncbi:uncharacterized protein LOC8051363 isoform X3 [Ixodes scapularis]|uniref:uncharacterized protein LOC8051363 isoform X3 n=1 Tax=Ixodes scapularis TaxID=6945 RepID=UPI001C38AB89|nr:uncharacterized protein LOC8051363 isoform X3 [Ixodes scapularis]
MASHRAALAALTLLLLLLPGGMAVCYFPVELHGTFLMQTQATSAFGGSVVSYSEITVEVDAIPPWGRCHRRRGHHVILRDSTGTEDCMRCFHLTLKTPNVIQIHAEGLARCYTNVEAARATCPDERAVSERRFTEIILYRKQSPDQASGGSPTVGAASQPAALHEMFCPINGRYRFQYRANGEEFRCAEPFSSELSNCPRGNGLTVRFRQCSFPDFDVSFVCLGDWENPRGGDRFLALMDLRQDPESRPRYRCGLYREEPGTGRVYVSLSSDSTCSTQLSSATSGYESLILTPVAERSLPAEVESAKCRFPDWSQGPWDRVSVQGGTFVFRDTQRFVTLTARCVARQSGSGDLLAVHGVTQCGEELYYCLRLRRRSLNVMEFQLGSSPNGHLSDSLCSDEQFADTAWVTQGRGQASTAGCPITGDYTGVIPGTTGLCARVASDCNNPDVMFYSVSSCDNKSHVAGVPLPGQLAGGRSDLHPHPAEGHPGLPVLLREDHPPRGGGLHQGGRRELRPRRGPAAVRHEDLQASLVQRPGPRAAPAEPRGGGPSVPQGEQPTPRTFGAPAAPKHARPLLVPGRRPQHQDMEGCHGSAETQRDPREQQRCRGQRLHRALLAPGRPGDASLDRCQLRTPRRRESR